MLYNPFWLKKHVITQNFWENPQMYAQFWWKWHNWIDFRCNKHNIFASHDGICRVKKDTTWYGWHIYIRRMMHDGGYETIYAHLSDIFVTDWQEVTKGTAIGKTGNTGNSTWPHLHYSLRFLDSDGKVEDTDNWYGGWVNPIPYFIEWAI